MTVYSFRVILWEEVWESRSLYVYIYIFFFGLFLKDFFMHMVPWKGIQSTYSKSRRGSYINNMTHIMQRYEHTWILYIYIYIYILLYGCTTWTLTKRLEKKLDGNYTRMLRAILNKSWRQHQTRHQLYCHLPPITKLSKLDEPDMQDTAGEARTSS